VDVGDLTRAVRGGNVVVPATLASVAFAHDEHEEARDVLSEIQALDFCTYLPGSVLAKVDRASMAHGLEVRPALLDDDLVDFALALPSRFKVRGAMRAFARKALLKRAAAGYVPREVRSRNKKGFGIPLARWIAGPLAPAVGRVLHDSPAWEALDQRTFRAWANEHATRRVDRSKPLWALLVLDRWLKRTSVR
jgi:asparagine synthase (glutamine-hydrolysing)